MTIISLIIALELSLVANAFHVQSDAYIGQGNFTNGCAKALAAEVECNRYAWSLGQYGYIGWVGDARLADAICTATCSDSLRSWNETVARECAEDSNRPDPDLLDGLITQANHIRQMWNATCIKDTKSSYYCLEIMDNFSDKVYGEETTYKESCHPCYGMVLTALLNSSLGVTLWGLDDKYWKGQLELVHKQCGGPGTIEEHFEEAKAFNATHNTTRVSESDKNDAALLMVNLAGGIWVVLLIHGVSIFVL
ncbi:hypothetical protein HG530_014851 [Fusarium avenaceum]|nr:hypothetical protein DER45DRAFT_632313 [Fusarium avenaceum]KAI6750570.1 hypothetical protein HG530_014851 [Fusarium avenaceum]